MWRRRPSIIVMAGLCVLAFVYLFGQAVWGRWQLAQELRRIRQAGEPTTPEELAATYRVPEDNADATEAWLLPLMAIENRALGKHPYGILLLDQGDLPPPPGESWPEQERVVAFLAKHAALLQQIDASLTAKGECCYLDDFDGGYQTLLPHTQSMREVQRLLLLRAYVAAHDGDAAGVVRNLGAALRATETLAREPVMVTQTARLIRNQEVVDALERLLPQTPLDDPQLAKLQEELSRIDYHPALAVTVKGERVMGLQAFSDAETAGAGKTPDVLYQAFIRDQPVAYLNIMDEILEAVQGDWPAPLRMTEQYKAASIDELSVAAPWGGGNWATPSGVVGPLRGLIERAARETARIRAAEAGVAAMRFRAATGDWPQDWEELSPDWLDAAPIDPFTGDALKLQVNGDELRVYSVGIDGVDDGGAEVEEASGVQMTRQGKPDVVFTVRGR